MNLDLAVPATAVVAVAIAAGFVYRFQRQVPSRRAFVLNREDSLGPWQLFVTPEQLPVVHSLLLTICDAFLFKPTDASRLRPDDRLMAIYQSVYPPGLGLADALETEILFDALHKDFGVPEDDIRHLWSTNPTLRDIWACCLAHAKTPTR
jgi:hypothetical protein